MLPNEAVNATILWDGFKGAIRGLVRCCRTTDGYIVNIWYGELVNLQLKDVCHVIVEMGTALVQPIRSLVR